jgi:hypothetical protein
MSMAKRGLQTEVINGKIYAIGGQYHSTYLNQTDVYDPSTNTWTTLKPMSMARSSFQTEVVDGKIYAIGGQSGTTYLNQTEVYDPVSDTWTTLASMSVVRAILQTEVVNGCIYALGGHNGISSVESYAIATFDLPAPANLSALAGVKQISLTWDAVDGAGNYNIKRSEIAGGPYTTVSSVTGSAIKFIDTGLTNGKTYYYVVSAVNSGGESANSNEASATPIAPANVLKLVLEVKEQKQLSVADDMGKNSDMTWTSSDTVIATVDENGLVKALKPGDTVITCTSKDGDYTETIKVLVVDLDLQLAVDLLVGETCRLTIDDAANTANVTWTSYNPAIATVTNKGKVTAVSEGLTYITATDGEGKEIGRIYIRVRQ